MKKNQNNYLNTKRLKVLQFAKVIVSEEGFKPETLLTISNNHKLDLNEIELLFPEGNINLIQFALEQLNNDLKNYFKKINLIRLPLHKRIRKILLAKIYLMNKEKKFYRKIFLNTLIPNRNISMPIQLYNSIDQIWFIAGDASVDFNFYSKRLILAAIYIRVIFFFFNNDDQKTLENILDENLKRVAKIPEIKSKLNIFKNYLPKIVKFVKNTT